MLLRQDSDLVVQSVARGLEARELAVLLECLSEPADQWICCRVWSRRSASDSVLVGDAAKGEARLWVRRASEVLPQNCFAWLLIAVVSLRVRVVPFDVHGVRHPGIRVAVVNLQIRAVIDLALVQIEPELSCDEDRLAVSAAFVEP